MISPLKYWISKGFEKPLTYHLAVLGLVLFLLVAVAHDIIPGLHIEDEGGNEVVCPFCKLIYSPALPVIVFLVILIVSNKRPAIWAPPPRPKFVSIRTLSCRAPPLLWA